MTAVITTQAQATSTTPLLAPIGGELIRGLHSLTPRHQGSVVTIGAFDGVHLGHRAILEQVVAKAKQLGLPSVAMVWPCDKPSGVLFGRSACEVKRLFHD